MHARKNPFRGQFLYRMMSLSNDEWDETHEASILDRSCELALVLTTDAGVATCLHTAV